MTAVILVFLAVIALVIIIFVVVYNRMVALRNQYKNAFAQIDVQLKRRYDLIPNLVKTAKAYLEHERETLEAVIAARNQARDAAGKAASSPGDPGAMGQLAGAEGMLAGALGRLFAVVENYPDLKADQNMRQLSEELTSTENRISFARQAFNDMVMVYNTYIQSFPGVIMAGPFNFEEAKLLEIEGEAHREAPAVDL